jgi:hypothetical protein
MHYLNGNNLLPELQSVVGVSQLGASGKVQVSFGPLVFRHPVYVSPSIGLYWMLWLDGG